MTNKRPLHGIARQRHLARLQRQQNEGYDMVPDEAIEWLLYKAKLIIIGRNWPLQIANLIRRLVRERTAALMEIDKLKTPPPPKPVKKKLGTEGNGTWDLPSGDPGEK